MTPPAGNRPLADQAGTPEHNPGAGETGPANIALASLAAGAVFVRTSALIPESLTNFERVAISSWSWHVGMTDGEFHLALKKAGWSWFYLGDVITVKVYGRVGGETMARLFEKALIAIHRHNPNTFTVTAVTTGSTLGFKTVSMSVQARHLQRGIPEKRVNQ